jgi:hypothetical protein
MMQMNQFPSPVRKGFLFLLLTILSFNLQADIWKILPGRANDIATGANGDVWIIGNTPQEGGFNIQRWNGTAWESIDGGGDRIAVDPKGMPWVVNTAGQVWQRSGSRWIQKSEPGAAYDIGIGANGQVWIVSRRRAATGGYIVQYLTPSGWTDAAGAGALRISVGPTGNPWIVNTSNQLFEWKSRRWESRPGAAKDVGIGANGVVWVIGANPVAGSFDIHRWDGVSQWERADGGGTQIAVDHFGRPWIVNHLKEIYRREYTPNALSASPAVSAPSMSYGASGRLSAICVDPYNANHVIAAGESGGLFETTNARASSRTWTHQSAFGQHSVTDILILQLPGGAQEVYVTVEETFESATTPLIWKRDTRGAWSRVTFSSGTRTLSGNQASAFRIVKSKTNNTLYACGMFGIATKPEGSETWSLMGTPPGSGVVSLETMSDGALIAGVISGVASGVFYSTNNGSQWFPAACPVAMPNFSGGAPQRFSLKADPDGRVALIARYTGTGMQLFGSTDGGRNWARFASLWGRTRVSGNAVGGYESVFPIQNLARERLEIYVSNAENAYYAFAPGATAQAALSAAMPSAGLAVRPAPSFNSGFGFNAGHEDTRQFAFLEGSPRKMIITSDGGFSIADIAGDAPESYSWVLENASSGLNALQIFNLTGNNRELYIGTMDNAYGYNAAGDGRAWTMGGGREGIVLNRQGVGYDAPWTVYGINSNFGKMTGNFTPVNECSPSSSSGRWNSPTAAGQGIPIWFGAGIYIQDDGAASGAGFKWKISFDNGCAWENLPVTTYARTGEKTYFSSSANSPFNLYVPIRNTNNNTIVLGRLANPLNRDATNTWQYPLMAGLDGGIALAGNQFLFNPVLAVNPANPQHMLACEANTGKLKVSQTGGGNWTEVTSFATTYSESGKYSLRSNKNTYAIWSIEFSPYDPQIVLIGTVSRGLFLSRDGGATWTRLNYNGIFMPTDFHWKSPREVFVSSYGRGIFRIGF